MTFKQELDYYMSTYSAEQAVEVLTTPVDTEVLTIEEIDKLRLSFETKLAVQSINFSN